MTAEDLNLYRNTYNAGMRNGILEFAERIRHEIKLSIEDPKTSDPSIRCGLMNALYIIDKHLKEALDETGRSGAAGKGCMRADNEEGSTYQCSSGQFRCCGLDKKYPVRLYQD